MRARRSVEGENGETACAVLVRGNEDAVDVDRLVADGQDMQFDSVELRFVFVDDGRVGEA